MLLYSKSLTRDRADSKKIPGISYLRRKWDFSYDCWRIIFPESPESGEGFVIYKSCDDILDIDDGLKLSSKIY
jgi:hypothetical protein